MATETAPSRTTLPYLAPLDGLRGLLVLPVMLFHFSITAGAGMLIAPGSYFAPSMFFSLSGFLITSLLLVEREGSGRIDGATFWVRRFRRLVPASLFIILGCVLISVVWPDTWSLSVGDVTASIFSVQNWHLIAVENSDNPLRLLSPLAPYWSLAVEEQFYLGLFTVIVLTARSRHRIKMLTTALVAVWCASAATVLILQGSTVRELFGTDTRASELVAGCLLAVAVQRFGWPRHRWWVVAGWVSMVATLWLWAVAEEQAQWVRDGGLIFISVLNVGLIGGAVSSGSFGTALSWRPLVELGKISYPVYLIHWPVALVMSPERMGMTGWPLIIVRFIVSFVLGFLIAQYVERPFRRRGVLPGWRALALWWATAAFTIGLAVASFGA